MWFALSRLPTQVNPLVRDVVAFAARIEYAMGFGLSVHVQFLRVLDTDDLASRKEVLPKLLAGDVLELQLRGVSHLNGVVYSFQWLLLSH